MLFFNANLICYYFYPTKKREEPFFRDGMPAHFVIHSDILLYCTIYFINRMG